MEATSPVSKRQLVSRSKLTTINRVRLLTAQALMGVARELAYQPFEQFRPELVDLKHFMRRAFQALTYNGTTGDYAEFGCFGGRTFTLAHGAAKLVGHDAHLWAFDSFEGLPATEDPRDAHVGWAEGAMAMSEQHFVDQCRSRGMAAGDFTTVKGFYSETLRDGAPGPRPQRICFAYVDCDLYSSAVEVLTFLLPRLCNGAIVAFDDYYCYGDTHPSGERLAAGEVFGRQDDWRLVPFIQWGWAGMSFIVESTRSAPSSGFSFD